MTRTITGLFDTRQAAEATVAHLKSHDGVKPDRIHIHGGKPTPGSTESAEDQGFWASLKSLFLPDEDHAAYFEGIRRGGVVVSAEVDEGLVKHAIEVFERNGAVDLDTRVSEWRSGGWTDQKAGGTTLGTTAAPGGMGLAASGAPGAKGTGTGTGTTAGAAGTTTSGSTGTARGMDTSGGMTGGVPAGSGIAASGEAARTAAATSATKDSGIHATGHAASGTGPVGSGQMGGTPGADMTRTGLAESGKAATGTGSTTGTTGTTGTVSKSTVGATGTTSTTGATGATGATGTAGTVSKSTTGVGIAGLASTSDQSVLPVIEEQLRVSKRDTERGTVRVRTYIVERPVTEEVSLRSEHVNVERRPVDRPLGSGEDAFRERTIEAVEHSEVPVVSKEARVVEEVVVTKDVSQRKETVSDTVRRQEVKVEDTRTPGKGPPPRNPA